MISSYIYWAVHTVYQMRDSDTGHLTNRCLIRNYRWDTSKGEMSQSVCLRRQGNVCVFVLWQKHVKCKLRLQRLAKYGQIKEKLYICYSPKNCKYEHLAHRTWKKDHAVKHHGNHRNSSEAQKLNQTGKQLLSAGSGTGQEGAATLWLALKTLLGALFVLCSNWTWW